jgi:hypothetical protein
MAKTAMMTMMDTAIMARLQLDLPSKTVQRSPRARRTHLQTLKTLCLTFESLRSHKMMTKILSTLLLRHLHLVSEFVGLIDFFKNEKRNYYHDFHRL